MADEKLNTINAVKLLELISQNKIQFSLCDINKKSSVVQVVKKLLYLKKDSLSLSETFFGNLVLISRNEQLPVVFKIYENKEKEDKETNYEMRYIKLLSLEYEINVYKYITENILNKKLSPNFVGYVGSACCDNGMENIIDVDNEKIVEKEVIKRINNFKHGSFCMLVTEQAGIGSYFGINNALNIYPLEFVLDKLNSFDLNMIFFQVLHALYVLQKLKIQHNDLHLGNILIAEYTEKITLYFKAENRIFKIKTRYIPYIIDWDLSYAENVGKNPLLDSFINRRQGFGTNEIENRDFYTFFCFTLKKPTNVYSESFFIEANKIIENLSTDSKNLFNTKEQYKTAILLTEDKKEILNHIQPIGQDERFTYYKLSGRQIAEVFGNNKYEKFNSGIIVTDNNPTYILVYKNIEVILMYDEDVDSMTGLHSDSEIYNISLERKDLEVFIESKYVEKELNKVQIKKVPFGKITFAYSKCRRTMIDPEFPTPEDIIMSYDYFEDFLVEDENEINPEKIYGI